MSGGVSDEPGGRAYERRPDWWSGTGWESEREWEWERA